MEDELFIISSVKPVALTVIEPKAMACDMFMGKSPEQVSADRLLALASSVYSRWFLLMRSIMTRERIVARAKYESTTGKRIYGDLPYSKAPCERQPLTAADEATLSACEATIRATFGDEAADFARDRFLRAIDTGDKRSFKIRFLFYKSCDGLKDTTLYTYFRERLEDVVTEAEEAAGCTPDPSPRRLSLAEQERKRRKDSIPKQMDLFDIVKENGQALKDGKYNENSIGTLGGDNTGGMVHSDGTSNYDKPGIDNDNRTAKVSAIVSGSEDTGKAKTEEGKGEIDNALGNDVAGVVSSGKGNPVGDHEPCNISSSGSSSPVSSENSIGRAKRKAKKRKESEAVERVVRKTRVYTSVSEIVADIASGAIVPYSKNEEVITDLKAEHITPAEAVLFLAELGKRNRSALMSTSVMSRLSRSEGAKFSSMIKDDSPSDDDLDDIDEEDDDDEDDARGDRLPSERGSYGSDYDDRRNGKYDYNSDDDW